METLIHPITLSLPYRMGNVNCYLVKTGTGYFLIDTGSRNQRAAIESEIVSVGCQRGDLRLILLTHGDFDHSGNAAYLREKFDSKIAMHPDDSGMVERGDMFWNRKQGPAWVRMIAPVLFGFGKQERFTPDVMVGDGFDLSYYGLCGQVIAIPGHSKGSIGIILTEKDAMGRTSNVLFCGDLLENIKKPALNSIMDDLPAAMESVQRVSGSNLDILYPGHGKPFSTDTFVQTQ